jgi:hypothetical protein
VIIFSKVFLTVVFDFTFLLTNGPDPSSSIYVRLKSGKIILHIYPPSLPAFRSMKGSRQYSALEIFPSESSSNYMEKQFPNVVFSFEKFLNDVFTLESSSSTWAISRLWLDSGCSKERNSSELKADMSIIGLRLKSKIKTIFILAKLVYEFWSEPFNNENSTILCRNMLTYCDDRK